jgi:hypothetical protein
VGRYPQFREEIIELTAVSRALSIIEAVLSPPGPIRLATGRFSGARTWSFAAARTNESSCGSTGRRQDPPTGRVLVAQNSLLTLIGLTLPQQQNLAQKGSAHSL